MKVAVSIHLGSMNFWDEFCGYLDNFNSSKYISQYDIYFHLIPTLNSDEIKNQILKKYPLAIITTYDNRGFDIAGKLCHLKYMLETNKINEYFYLLFIFMCKMISINNDNLKEFINLNLVRRPFFIFSSSFC